MAKAVKKIDGRSKEARALRAKTAAKNSPVWNAALAARKPRRSNAEIAAANEAKSRKPRAAKAKPATEPSFDAATTLRILALQMASNNVGRDTAPRDLVPLARQIEEFLTGAAHNRASGAISGYRDVSVADLERELAGTREFVAQMDLRAQREKSAAARAVETLTDAKHAFD
jgi:hypothetical protein